MDRYGLGSSHYSWSPGLEAEFIDPLVVQPHTSIRGTRGVRVAFGQEEADEEVDDLFGALEDEIDADLADLEADDDYGRLYMGAQYHELDHASPADMGALIGRSGSSGYRGGRPTYGAAVSFGPMQYEGTELGVFAIALGGLVVMAKGSGLF